MLYYCTIVPFSGLFHLRSRSVSGPFQVRFKSVPIYRRYKPHDRVESFGEVRTMVINGEPWFVGKDVAMILGYAKPENAIPTHVDSEDKTSSLIQGSSGVQNGHKLWNKRNILHQ